MLTHIFSFVSIILFFISKLLNNEFFCYFLLIIQVLPHASNIIMHFMNVKEEETVIFFVFYFSICFSKRFLNLCILEYVI